MRNILAIPVYFIAVVIALCGALVCFAAAALAQIAGAISGD